MIFSFYIYSQYLWLLFPISPQYCQHLDRQLTYPLTPPHHPQKKKKKKKKEKHKNNGSPPWHPTQSVDFLMFICCAISYWQPCVNLECTSDQMLQEQITWSKIPTSESNRYIFYKILIIDCTVPRFFQMSPTFWRVGAPGPQNWNSWLEHCSLFETLHMFSPGFAGACGLDMIFKFIFVAFSTWTLSFS